MNLAIVADMQHRNEKYNSDYTSRKGKKLVVLYEKISMLESENRVLKFANQKALDYINSIENPSRDIKTIRDLLTIN